MARNLGTINASGTLEGVAVAEQRIIGRKTGGDLGPLTAAEVRLITGVDNLPPAIAVSDESTALTASTSVPLATFHLQSAGTWAEILIGLTTANTGSVLTGDVHLNGTTVFSTKPTIDAGEKTSVTAATAAVLSTTTFAKGDLVELFADGVGATVAGAGLKFYFNYA